MYKKTFFNYFFNKLTCYDDSGNVIINENELTYKNNTESDPKMCKNLKK